MRTISEIKERGKADMKANYGMSIVVSLIFSVVAGGSAGYSGSNVSRSAGDAFKNSGLSSETMTAIIGAVIGVLIIIIIIGFILEVFLFNPLKIGCQNFFVKNTAGPAELGDLGRAFKPSWVNNIITMFLCDLFIGLWFCLFIIPGFVKLYSYRLVPYIQAENPDMKGTEAITLSRKLMNGNKWRAFCFDLSFFGWFILGVITCGIVGVLYVAPYYNCSCAEFYKAIKDENTVVADTVEL